MNLSDQEELLVLLYLEQKEKLECSSAHFFEMDLDLVEKVELQTQNAKLAEEVVAVELARSEMVV